MMPLTRDYRLLMPGDTLVVAACADVGCENWRYGWDTLIDESTDLGREQAAYIRQQSGRTFREMRAPDGLTVFRFDSGQRCFAEHRTKPARAVVTHGRRLVYEHVRLQDFADDYNEHIGRVADQIERG